MSHQLRGSNELKDLKWEVMIAREARDKKRRDRALELSFKKAERRMRWREWKDRAENWALIVAVTVAIGFLLAWWLRLGH